MLPRLIPIVLSTAAFAGPIGELQTHRDWIVGCDNLQACHATTLDPAPTPEEVQTGADSVADNAVGMAILRGAGTRDAPRLRLLACYQCDPAGPDPAAVRLLSVLDKAGKPLLHQTLSPREAKQASTARGWAIPASSALIPALAAGEVLNLDGAANQPLAVLSLRGLGDALRHMDKQQHRLGNMSALVVRGDGTANMVPPRITERPLIIPPVSALPPKQLAAAELLLLKQRHQCDGRDGLPTASYHRLDAHTTLLLLQAACAPYNGEGTAYLVNNRGLARLAPVRILPGDPPLEAPQVMSAYWDRQVRRLHSFERGRAMADCGQQSAFAWDGIQFLLVEEADMGGCRGSIDYITVYRRETRVGKALTP